jgi:hypothetical protein
MAPTIRIHTQVLAGGRIELLTPQFSEGEAVDVVVTPSNVHGGGAQNRRELLRLPLEQRRELLARQSERLEQYYSSASDRAEWQGGDILE